MISMPIMTLLDSVPSQPWFIRVFKMTMVEDSEISEPNQRAVFHSQPNSRPIDIAKANGQKHLQRRADKGNIFDRAKIFEGKFQAKGKQQQCHPDFGKQFNIVDFGNRHAAGMRAKDDAGQNIPENQRLMQPLHNQTTERMR